MGLHVDSICFQDGTCLATANGHHGLLEIDILGGSGPSSAPTRYATSNTLGLKFDLGDIAYCHAHLPPDIDRSVDATLRSHWFPTASDGGGEGFQWTTDILSVASGTDMTTTTGSITGEVAVGTANLEQRVELTIAAATYLGSTVEELHIKLTRVACSLSYVDPPVSTDPVLHSAELIYTPVT